MAVILRMDCHCMKRTVMLLVGLLFCIVIIALTYNTITTWGGDHRTLWVDIPSRLSFLIICCFIIGLCGYLPFPNSLRPDFMPEPILVWKFWNCRDVCYTEGGEQWIYVRDEPRDDLNNVYNVQQSSGPRLRSAREYTNLENQENRYQENRYQENRSGENQLRFNRLPRHERLENFDIPESTFNTICKTVPQGVDEASPLRTEYSDRPNHPQIPWRELGLERYYALKNERYQNGRPRPNYNAITTPRQLECSFRDEIFVFEDEPLRNENEFSANGACARFSTVDSRQYNLPSKCITGPHVENMREIRADIFRDVSHDEQALIELPMDSPQEVDIFARQGGDNTPTCKKIEECEHASAVTPSNMINTFSRSESASEVQAFGRHSTENDCASRHNPRHESISDSHYLTANESPRIIAGTRRKQTYQYSSQSQHQEIDNEHSCSPPLNAEITIETEKEAVSCHSPRQENIPESYPSVLESPRIIAGTRRKQTYSDTSPSQHQEIDNEYSCAPPLNEDITTEQSFNREASSIARNVISEEKTIQLYDGSGGVPSDCGITFGIPLRELQELQSNLKESTSNISKGPL